MFGPSGLTSMEPVVAPLAFAAKVCLQCKAKKRKCNKGLPCCELCVKLVIMCQYDDESRTSSSNPASQTLFESTGNNGSGPHCLADWPASSSFLALFSNRNLYPGLTTSFMLNAQTSKYVLEIVTSSGQSSISNMVETYFNTIHTWLPIVSQTELMSRLDHVLSRPSAEFALLLLSMHLITQMPSGVANESMCTATYFAAKSLLAAIMCHGEVSLMLVQSSTLIVYYEQGHGMMETARISMAACAAMGRKLLSRVITMDKPQDTYEGRTWWGIVMLDRALNIGRPPEQIYLTTGPSLIDIPSDENIGEEGSHPVFLSANGLHIHSFYRTAQAVSLLGDALDFSVASVKYFDMDRAICLDRALQSLGMTLLELATNRLENCCAAINMWICAILTLHVSIYNALRYTDNPQRKKSLLAIQTAMRMVVETSKRFNGDRTFVDILSVSTLSFFANKQVLTFYARFADDKTEGHIEEIAKDLETALIHLRVRWSVDVNS